MGTSRDREGWRCAGLWRRRVLANHSAGIRRPGTGRSRRLCRSPRSAL